MPLAGPPLYQSSLGLGWGNFNPWFYSACYGAGEMADLQIRREISERGVKSTFEKV